MLASWGELAISSMDSHKLRLLKALDLCCAQPFPFWLLYCVVRHPTGPSTKAKHVRPRDLELSASQTMSYINLLSLYGAWSPVFHYSNGKME
jgi:hypothetical protein